VAPGARADEKTRLLQELSAVNAEPHRLVDIRSRLLAEPYFPLDRPVLLGDHSRAAWAPGHLHAHGERDATEHAESRFWGHLLHGEHVDLMREKIERE
jgi:hypothetical protein